MSPHLPKVRLPRPRTFFKWLVVSLAAILIVPPATAGVALATYLFMPLPASLPQELAAKISRDVQAVMALPETKQKLAGASVVIWEDSQANFRRAFLADIAKWREIVKISGAKPDQ